MKNYWKQILLLLIRDFVMKVNMDKKLGPKNLVVRITFDTNNSVIMLFNMKNTHFFNFACNQMRW
ncbi:MAG: hypothetical protein NPMRTH4_400003 [Nitrosopumilales archaeon]|nr:MAG: hypothetical protein NPMRTH4_400003 [Nitrosopumilales archaeon]